MVYNIYMDESNLQRVYEEIMDLAADLEAKMFEFSEEYANFQDTQVEFDESDI